MLTHGLTVSLSPPPVPPTRNNPTHLTTTPSCPHITGNQQEVYAEQIEIIRPVVLKQDPHGLFRTRLLSDIFRLPY